MEIKDFFVKLAERSNENSLSDITWALMETVPKFKEDFLNFFKFEFEYPLEVQREYIFEGTNLRIDFSLIAKDKIFLIENKIWDINYHIKDYSKAANKIKDYKFEFGILLNHYMLPDSKKEADTFNWKVKTWQDLYNYLKKINYGELQFLIDGYLKYLWGVCDMVDIKQIKFSKETLISLCYLLRLIKKIIDSSSHDDFVYKYYTTSRAFSSIAVGFYYSITNNKSNKAAYPWFGIEFSEEPIIGIWIDKDWNFFFDNCVTLMRIKDDYFTMEKYNDNGLDIVLLPELFNKFNQSNVAEQEEMLRGFFKHVNSFFEQHLF